MQKIVKMTLEGKTSRKWASGQNIYEFETEEINPRGYSDSVLDSWGYVHVYDLYSQTSFIGIYLRSQVSVYKTIGPLLKLGMKHQGMEVYKICINHYPGMTLTYFTTR